MKVTILNGSPRKIGNTKNVVTLFANSIDNKKHEVSVIDVALKKVYGCTACQKCIQNNNNCVHDDDSAEIIKTMVASDLIVFASPVYFFAITSQLKAIVDKMFSNKQGLRDKKIAVLIVGAQGLDNKQYSMIQEQFECIAKARNFQLLFTQSFSAWKEGEILENNDTTRTIKDLAQTI